MKDTDLKGCIYNRYKNPYCPIFRLGDIVSEAKENFTEMAVEVNAFRSTHTKIYTYVQKQTLKEVSNVKKGCIYLIKTVIL